ncbi:MAG: WG repeat-containing protein [Bacteroidetes bacterium]|nr:WG repeat-containing protein [Bacteroidota bacterium]
MAQQSKKGAPRPDFNTDGKVFTVLSWCMGSLCIVFAVLYALLAASERGTEAEIFLTIAYVIGANIILPPIRRQWEKWLRIRLYGNRLVYLYLGLFLLVMGLGQYSSMRQEQFIKDYQARHAIGKVTTRVPVDSLLAPAQQGLFWGYVNTRGQWVIPADQYEAAGPFSNGYARVQLQGKSLVIDRKGKQVDDAPREKAADSLRIMLKPVRHQGLWGWQDSTGRWAISPAFDAVGAWGRAYSPADKP